MYERKCIIFHVRITVQYYPAKLLPISAPISTEETVCVVFSFWQLRAAQQAFSLEEATIYSIWQRYFLEYRVIHLVHRDHVIVNGDGLACLYCGLYTASDLSSSNAAVSDIHHLYIQSPDNYIHRNN